MLWRSKYVQQEIPVDREAATHLVQLLLLQNAAAADDKASSVVDAFGAVVVVASTLAPAWHLVLLIASTLPSSRADGRWLFAYCYSS